MHPLGGLGVHPQWIKEGTTVPSQPSARFGASKLECSDDAKALEKQPYLAPQLKSMSMFTKGSVAPFCRAVDLASEKLCDQVHTAYKWQSADQGAAFLIFRTELFLPHHTASLVNSCASLAPSTGRVSCKQEIFLKPGSTHRY